MPNETIGDVEHVVTANHPQRKDSAEYGHTRVWLMKQSGGCYVCNGPVDMSHPFPAEHVGMQDHHGGGIFLYTDHGEAVLVGFNLIGMEWSLGWGAEPKKVDGYVKVLNEVTKRLGGEPYGFDIASTADVMQYVDSPANANVKLCAVHHIAHESKHTPDSNGNEGVGIHNGPFPIWLGQVTCDWKHWDMWGGTTGTLCVGHPGNESGEAVVLHVSADHPDKELLAAHRDAQGKGEQLTLPNHNMHARLAHAGTLSS